MIKRSLIFWLNLSAPDRDDKTWSILEERISNSPQQTGPHSYKNMTPRSGIKYSILNDAPVHGRLFPARPLRLPPMPE